MLPSGGCTESYQMCRLCDNVSCTSESASAEMVPREPSVVSLGFSQRHDYYEVMEPEIGRRVLERIGQVSPDRKHREIAEHIGMTPDGFSRALNGKRAFSSLELARVADLLGADIHWLITGTPDPHRLVVAARHDFDPYTRERSVPGRDDDGAMLRDIALAYQQAFDDGPDDLTTLPTSPGETRTALGQGFVHPFADRLEDRLRVDVVRVADVSTAYSFTVCGRPVIVVPATGNWFRENWSIAHEFAHLALEHHDDGLSPTEWDQHESAANAFAADLLLPLDQMQQTNWSVIDAGGLARIVWETGVSADALARRVLSLGLPCGDVVKTWAGLPTQRLLRRHWQASQEDGDPITQRMDAAATRRFPLSLQDAHLEKIATGALGKGTLAWMLGIDRDALEVDAPVEPEEVDTDLLANALGL